jgi:hypothetical protein
MDPKVSIKQFKHAQQLMASDFFKNFLFIYSHVHTLFGPFLLPAPCPLPLSLTPPHFQAEPGLPLSLILLKSWPLLSHLHIHPLFLLDLLSTALF